MDHDFRNIKPARRARHPGRGERARAAPFAPDLGESAREQLKAMGVDVRTGTRVNDLDAGGVIVDGERIAARTCLWAAGVAGSPLGKTLGCPLDRAGRVMINRDLSVPGHPEIQVIGDLAALEQDGKQLPGVAPAAMQMGRHAASNILRRARGDLPVRSSTSTRGRWRRSGRPRPWRIYAVALKGTLAWLAWLFGAHHVPDRIQEPVPGAVRVGLELRVLRAWGPADHRAHARRAAYWAAR